MRFLSLKRAFFHLHKHASFHLRAFFCLSLKNKDLQRRADYLHAESYFCAWGGIQEQLLLLFWKIRDLYNQWISYIMISLTFLAKSAPNTMRSPEFGEPFRISLIKLSKVSFSMWLNVEIWCWKYFLRSLKVLSDTPINSAIHFHVNPIAFKLKTCSSLICLIGLPILRCATLIFCQVDPNWRNK